MLNTTGIEQASEGTIGALISAGLIFIGDDNRMHAAQEGTKAELLCRIQEEQANEGRDHIVGSGGGQTADR